MCDGCGVYHLKVGRPESSVVMFPFSATALATLREKESFVKTCGIWSTKVSAEAVKRKVGDISERWRNGACWC